MESGLNWKHAYEQMRDINTKNETNVITCVGRLRESNFNTAALIHLMRNPSSHALNRINQSSATDSSPNIVAGDGSVVNVK